MDFAQARARASTSKPSGTRSSSPSSCRGRASDLHFPAVSFRFQFCVSSCFFLQPRHTQGYHAFHPNPVDWQSSGRLPMRKPRFSPLASPTPPHTSVQPTMHVQMLLLPLAQDHHSHLLPSAEVYTHFEVSRPPPPPSLLL